MQVWLLDIRTFEMLAWGVESSLAVGNLFMLHLAYFCILNKASLSDAYCITGARLLFLISKPFVVEEKGKNRQWLYSQGERGQRS
jgi:hypothetical protein